MQDRQKNTWEQKTQSVGQAEPCSIQEEKMAQKEENVQKEEPVQKEEKAQKEENVQQKQNMQRKQNMQKEQNVQKMKDSVSLQADCAGAQGKETAQLPPRGGWQERRLDVIIPTFHPGSKFVRLLEALGTQNFPVNKVIIMNTEEELFGQVAARAVEEQRAAGMQIEVHHLPKAAFDHAGTRQAGVQHSEAEAFLCMTDDAVPADSFLTKRLMQVLYGGTNAKGEADAAEPGEQAAGTKIAMAYARQLADKDCREAERFTRLFNYPPEASVKSAKDLPRLGIKTYFASNVCCAYDRAVFTELGGFCSTAIFNEDMVYAASAIKAGFCIAYAAQACVIHSHNYTAGQQFHRNFDMGVSQALHPEVFSGLPAEGEGVRLVLKTAEHLLKRGKPWLLPGLFIQSACKYAGYRLGKKWAHLPKPVLRYCLMNRAYLPKLFEEQKGAQKR